MAELDRFIQAQNKSNTYKQAYDELAKGAKTSHWIWYIFPQLKGLGTSHNAEFYGIKNLKEACDYLQNKELFEKYQKITLLVSQQLDKGIPINTLMGSSIDASKLASSMTLFHATASFLAKQGKNDHDYANLAQLCDQILTKINGQGYQRCIKTINMITPQIEQATKQESKQPSKQKPKLSSKEETTKPTTPSTDKKSSEIPPKPFFTNKSKEQNKEKPQVKVDTPHHDYSALSKALGDYINKRKKEWSFHYNFLGFVALVYLIEDAVKGTDHFNSKNRTIKIKAAENLKKLIDGPERDSIVFSSPEKLALADGRLGRIVSSHGGFDDIVNTVSKEHKPGSNQPSM